MSHFKIKNKSTKQVFWLYDPQVKKCHQAGELDNYIECDQRETRKGTMYGFRKKTADELQDDFLKKAAPLSKSV